MCRKRKRHPAGNVDAIHGRDSNVTIVSNYYSNEWEFNSNMEGFFHDPTPISEIVKSLSTRMLATLRIKKTLSTNTLNRFMILIPFVDSKKIVVMVFDFLTRFFKSSTSHKP